MTSYDISIFIPM